MATGAVGKEVELLFLDPVLDVAARAHSDAKRPLIPIQSGH
jgi:hypothetical protein